MPLSLDPLNAVGFGAPHPNTVLGAIRAELAIRLASALDTSPEFWLNSQQAVDVHSARRKIRDLPDALLMS